MAIKLLNEVLPVAKVENVGVVAPDGNTITITEEGKITSATVLPDNVVGADNYINPQLWKGTLAEYEALPEHLDTTTYIITDDTLATEVIDDSTISTTSTYSSQKITNMVKNSLPIIETTNVGNYLKAVSTDSLGWTADVFNHDYITNCLLEASHHIDLELNNGTLTLKAGSIVYVPNGFEADGSTKKFDKIILDSDITGTTSTTSTGYTLLYVNTSVQPYTFALLATDNGGIQWSSSGSIAPTSFASTYAFWWDTQNNHLQMTNDSGTTWTQGYSLPIAIVGYTGGNGYTAIDQVFDNFGYMGSTFFALPDLKGLMPSGFTDNNALKNTTFVIDDVLTKQVVSNTDYARLTISVTGELSYMTSEEIVYSGINNRNILASNGNYWEGCILPVGVRVSNSRAFAIGTFDPLKLVTNNDKSFIASQMFPGTKNFQLAIGADGTTYTAPADGYFAFYHAAPGNSVRIMTKSTGIFPMASAYTITGQANGCSCPVSKGESIVLSYSGNASNVHGIFVYAKGAL